MTAVEKLELTLLGIISFDSEELRAKYKERIANAKEMEKQQQGYSEEEVEDLIYKVCGTVARLQGITLDGNHIATAYNKNKRHA
jgi:hypothetical protein